MPSGVTRTLAGLRSRWTTPRSWAASSASAIWRAMSSASSTGSRPRASRCARSSPGTSSIARKRVPIRVVDAVDRGDVGVVQRGQQLGLALEAGQPLGVVGERVGQDLDRHLAVERGVDRLPDHTHPALADLLDQAVVEQSFA